MSASQLRLASYILKEHYGDIVKEVGLCILRKGGMSLACLKKETTLNISKIKKAVSVLIQHNLVKFEKNARNQIWYTGQLSNILGILQYPQYTFSAKTLFSNASELIVEELLHHGALSMTNIVKNVTQRLLDPALNQSEEVDEHYVASQFEELVSGHFLKRVIQDCPSGFLNKSLATEEELHENSDYSLPPGYTGSGKRKLESNRGGPAVKRRKGTDESLALDYEDDGILWHVNFVQFNHHLVNEMIENAVTSRIDEFAADIIKAMHKITILSRNSYSSQTKSVSVYDIAEHLSRSSEVDNSQIIQCLSLLEDDQIGFVSKTAENRGGMYAVNIEKTVEAICTQTVESVVQERCGSKSLRIFKLLMMKKQLEQKQVEEMIMVPSKEAKELLYNLLSENFVTLQINLTKLLLATLKRGREEVPRATDYAPSRTFYLFSVNISQICRMLLDRSYKAIGNLISRRHHEAEENKRLVEKSEKIEASVMALKSQGMDENSSAIQELQEMMTEQEKQQLAKLQTVQSKIEQAELQVSQTVLVFTQYLALKT